VSLGWKRDQPWLQEVHVSQNVPWDQADLTIQHPRAQWAKWGVTYPGGRALPADNMPASLLLPMGRFGPAFLAYDNFQVYLKWNNSLVYSTTAAYYATRLAGAPAIARSTGPVPAVTAEEVREIQLLLTRAGFDVGTADGKVGVATRAAIKKMQQKFGLPADSYPSPELLARLKAGR
jgi:transglycosylase-like protein with SLT domain/putative peptidoglycan binding protein